MRKIVAIGLFFGLMGAGSAYADSAGGAFVVVAGKKFEAGESRFDITVEIKDLRDIATGAAAPLKPGLPKFDLCLKSSARIVPLDYLLREQTMARPDNTTIETEDKFVFSKCVVASIKAAGAGKDRRINYCLRCQSMTWN